VTLIQDSAEALGAEYKGRPLGSHGPSAVFGFYANKQMTTGEGGVVVTHSEAEWTQLQSMRNQGRSYTEGASWFHHVRVGLNYRWTDVQAAIGIAQLERLDRILELRAEAARRYGELLADVDAVELPLADDAEHRRSWFVYVVKLAEGIDRAGVLAELRRAGIETAEYIPCIHLQPYMRERYGMREGMYPMAEDAAARTMALPFFTQIDADDQARVAETLRAAVGA
jgi:dTDP-4-amino-4,6-dideoxygalactose transaminase